MLLVRDAFFFFFFSASSATAAVAVVFSLLLFGASHASASPSSPSGRDGVVFALDSAPVSAAGGNVGVCRYASSAAATATGTVKNGALPSLAWAPPDSVPTSGGWDFSSTPAYLSVDRGSEDGGGESVLAVLGDPSATSGVTFAAWVRLSFDRSSGEHTFMRLAGLDDVVDISVGYSGDVGVLDFRLGPHSGGPSIKTAADGGYGGGVLDGEWHHVAVVADFAAVASASSPSSGGGDNLRVYVDGNVAATEAGDFTSSPTGAGDGKTLHIGARSNGGNPWPGSVADFAAFAFALTDEEVLQIYREGARSILVGPGAAAATTTEAPSGGGGGTSSPSSSGVRDSIVFALDVPPLSGSAKNRDVTGRDGASMANDDGGSSLPVLIGAAGVPSGQAWDFSSTDAYLSLDPRHMSIVTLLGDTDSTSGLTMSAWVNLDFVKAEHTGARLAGCGDVFDVVVSYSGDVGALDFILLPGSSGGPRVRTPTSDGVGILDGSWHHVALTVDFGEDGTNDLILYVDGHLADVESAGTALAEPFGTIRHALHIGARLTGGDPWPGSVSDVAFWTYALNPGEVAEVHGDGAASVRPNRPPVVRAGSSRVLLIQRGEESASCSLSASVEDETSLSDLSPRWSVARKGPASAADPVFSDASAPDPNVTFGDAGEYVLRLAVSDGEFDAFDTAVIFVVDEEESGIDLSTFLPAPVEPYVHPRVLFTEEDKVHMLARLQTTVAGGEYLKRLEANRILLTVGPDGFDRNAPYNRLRGGAGEVVDNVGYYGQFADVYRSLLAGDHAAFGLNSAMMIEMGRNFAMASQIFMEAVRCWLLDDDAGMADVAKAVTTWAEVVEPTIRPEDDWQWSGQNGHAEQELTRIFDKVGREFLGLAYDVSFNHMTPAQRDTVRAMIAKATAGKRGYGFDEPPHLRVGNWISFHTPPLILLSLCIEGEDGYDPNVYDEGVETMSDFFAYNLHADGEPFEPMGKGSLRTGMLEALARRGDALIAHPHLRAFVGRFLLNDIQPYGGVYMGETTLGGPEMSGAHGHVTVDAALMKRVYPTDSDVDLVYRNMLGDSFSTYYFDRTAYEMLSVTDFSGSMDLGDWEWNPDNALHFHGKEKGVVIMRSAWSKDAAWLYVTSGEDKRMRGHFDHNHGAFVYTALGRNWVSYYGSEEYVDVPQAHSIVTIDGIGVAASHGKVLDVSDNFASVFAAVDQSYAYNFSWKTGDNATQIVEAYNDFRYVRRPESWMDIPFKRIYSPFWGGFSFPAFEHNTVRHAFRTVGMIRGDRPYALVVDDIQKDENSHIYEFMLRIHEDVKSSAAFDGLDVIFSDPVGDQRFLVRLLHHHGTNLIVDMIDVQVKPFNPDEKRTNLRFKLESVSPRFVVMLYAFREGETMPTSTWSTKQDGSKTVTIQLPDGRIDEVNLKESDSGRRAVSHEVVYMPPPTDSPTPSPTSSPTDPCGDVPLELLHFAMDATPQLGAGAVTDSVGSTEGTLSEGVLPIRLSGDVPEGSGAWDFAGTGRHVAISPNHFTNMIGDTNALSGLTIAFWVKLDFSKSRDTNMRVAGLSQTFDISLGYVSGDVGVVDFTFGSGNNIPKVTLRSELPAGSVLDGDWHHLACTIDYASATDNFVLYADGVAVATASQAISSPFSSFNQPVRVGARLNGGNPFPGALDSFMIYERSIEECEIASLVHSNSGCGLPLAEILHFAMDESPQLGSNLITDSTGNTEATLTDDMRPTLVTNDVPDGLGAWNFAATGRHVAISPNHFTNMIGDTSMSNGLTIAFWVKLDFVKSRDTNMRVAGLSRTFDISLGYVSGNVGVVDFTFGDGSNMPKVVLRSVLPTGGSVLDGEWHHLACSVDYALTTDNFVLHADGAVVAKASKNVSVPFSSPNQPVRIGARLNGGNPFSGSLDSFKIYGSSVDRCMLPQGALF